MPLDANRLRPNPVDLFGDVPVTLPEIEAWRASLARLAGLSDFRAKWYLKNWDVAGKIRAAKLAGFSDAVKR